MHQPMLTIVGPVFVKKIVIEIIELVKTNRRVWDDYKLSKVWKNDGEIEIKPNVWVRPAGPLIIQSMNDFWIRARLGWLGLPWVEYFDTGHDNESCLFISWFEKK